jgi:hypothetical protein
MFAFTALPPFPWARNIATYAAVHSDTLLDVNNL